MDNTFIEQLVRQENKSKNILKKIGLIVLAIVLSVAGLFILKTFFPIVFVVICFGTWFLLRRIDKEYEYIYTDGNLDIDCIYHRSMRKRMVSLDCKLFQIIAPADEPQYQAKFNAKYDKVLNAGSGAVNSRTFIGIAKKDEKTLKLIFEPDERILESMKKYIPRTLVWKKPISDSLKDVR